MKDIQTAQKLFWIDLEMTGLDIQKEVVIEVAALVTDFDFAVLDEWETVVRQPQSFLAAMDDWNKKHHGESGLTTKVPQGMPPQEVEQHLIAMLEKNFVGAKEKPILCGNSIGQDRLFLAKYFQNFEARLHYRMLDVSSWKVIFNNKYNLKYQKKNSHRALDDIRESIEELKFYLSYMKM